MMYNTGDDYSFKVIKTYSTVSSLCIAGILLYLTYTDSIYDVGKHITYFVPMVIFGTELIKVYLRTNLSDSSQSGKDKSGKKSYMKVKMKELTKSIGLILVSVVIYYIVAVLFGAEVFSKCEETLMLSILVTTLTVVPSCLNLGAEQTVGFLIGKYTSSDPITDLILQGIHFTIIGTWLGAIPIPLDWDRPWQKWPITCYTGALLGYFAANLFSLVKLFPTFIKMYTGKTLKVGKTYNVKSKI